MIHSAHTRKGQGRARTRTRKAMCLTRTVIHLHSCPQTILDQWPFPGDLARGGRLPVPAARGPARRARASAPRPRPRCPAGSPRRPTAHRCPRPPRLFARAPSATFPPEEGHGGARVGAEGAGGLSRGRPSSPHSATGPDFGPAAAAALARKETLSPGVGPAASSRRPGTSYRHIINQPPARVPVLPSARLHGRPRAAPPRAPAPPPAGPGPTPRAGPAHRRPWSRPARRPRPAHLLRKGRYPALTPRPPGPVPGRPQPSLTQGPERALGAGPERLSLRASPERQGSSRLSPSRLSGFG